MALKRMNNGQYMLTNQKQVASAILMAQEMGAEIKALEKEHGIEELRMDSTELMKAATRWLDEHGVDSLELGDGRYAKLIKAEYDKRWIFDDAELSEVGLPQDAVSLRSIVRKKFRKNKDKLKEVTALISKRVANPEGIDEAVAAGLLSEDEIAPAYVSRTKAPYTRVFGTADEA